jgi:hypothetical protein
MESKLLSKIQIRLWSMIGTYRSGASEVVALEDQMAQPSSTRGTVAVTNKVDAQCGNAGNWQALLCAPGAHPCRHFPHVSFNATVSHLPCHNYSTPKLLPKLLPVPLLSF